MKNPQLVQPVYPRAGPCLPRMPDRTMPVSRSRCYSRSMVVFPYRRPSPLAGLLGIVALAMLGGLAAPLPAAQPRYRYGDYWWQEQIPTDKTALLIHFGPPQVSSREVAATRLDAEKKASVEAEFEDLEGLEASANAGRLAYRSSCSTSRSRKT